MRFQRPPKSEAKPLRAEVTQLSPDDRPVAPKFRVGLPFAWFPLPLGKSPMRRGLFTDLPRGTGRVARAGVWTSNGGRVSQRPRCEETLQERWQLHRGGRPIRPPMERRKTRCRRHRGNSARQ